jgi:hypothetical protein
MTVISSVVYIQSIMFTKLSILTFYIQLSPYRGFKKLVTILIVVVIGYCFASSVFEIFACRPITKRWDITIVHGSCGNLPLFYFIFLGFNTLTDFGMLLLPIPLLWNVQIPKRQKVGLGFILMTGSLYATSILQVKERQERNGSS